MKLNIFLIFIKFIIEIKYKKSFNFIKIIFYLAKQILLTTKYINYSIKSLKHKLSQLIFCYLLASGVTVLPHPACPRRSHFAPKEKLVLRLVFFLNAFSGYLIK